MERGDRRRARRCAGRLGRLRAWQGGLPRARRLSDAHSLGQQAGVHRPNDPAAGGTDGGESLSIAPGSPWENGYAESFHSRPRDELLNAEVFADVREARALAAAWRHEYNHRRPHSSLGYLPPAAFAAGLGDAAPGAAPRPRTPVGLPVGAAPLLPDRPACSPILTHRLS